MTTGGYEPFLGEGLFDAKFLPLTVDFGSVGGQKSDKTRRKLMAGTMSKDDSTQQIQLQVSSKFGDEHIAECVQESIASTSFLKAIPIGGKFWSQKSERALTHL